MMNQIFATKISMGQTWTKSGHRLPVSKLKVQDNLVMAKKETNKDGIFAVQVGYGTKKLKNMTKPLRSILEKSGFSLGAKQIREVKVNSDSTVNVGDTVTAGQVLKVGDIVNIQGVTKGRGFAGAMKRHGFHGGPATHGQSDRARAVGAIGQRTTPGRVFKGKKMPGHYGTDNLTIKNLQVVHLDPVTGEVWINGPIPGHFNSIVRLTVVGFKEFEGFDASITPTVTPVAENAEVAEVTQEASTSEKTEGEVQAEA